MLTEIDGGGSGGGGGGGTTIACTNNNSINNCDSYNKTSGYIE